MTRSLTTIVVAVLISFGVSVVFINFVGRPNIVGILTLLLIAGVLCRWLGILTGAVLITLLTQIPGALEVVMTVGILFIAALTVALLRSLSPDLPNTPPRRTTRRDTTTATNHTAGTVEYNPDALDLDTASVFADQGYPDVQTGTDTDSTHHQTARDRPLAPTPNAGPNLAPAEVPTLPDEVAAWELIRQDNPPNETAVGRWGTTSDDGVQHFVTVWADHRFRELVAPYEVDYAWRNYDHGIAADREQLEGFDTRAEAIVYAVRWMRQHPTGGPGPPQNVQRHHAIHQNGNA